MGGGHTVFFLASGDGGVKAGETDLLVFLLGANLDLGTFRVGLLCFGMAPVEVGVE